MELKCIFAHYVTKTRKQDLIMLADLTKTRGITTAVKRRYKLSEAPEARRYLGEGHARAIVVITVEC